MTNRKPPFVHIARTSEQQTSAPAQTFTGSILTRLRERLTGSHSTQAGHDSSAPTDDHWDNQRQGWEHN
jgi:uncharacterized protein (DUF2267 family)